MVEKDEREACRDGKWSIWFILKQFEYSHLPFHTKLYKVPAGDGRFFAPKFNFDITVGGLK